MKIGFTERGDAGLNLSWYDKCLEGKCDGLIAITKNLTPGCMDRLLDLYDRGFPVILHAGVTGLGSVSPKLELNTPCVSDSLERIQMLIDCGFPKDHIVLRIDPVVLDGYYAGAPFMVLDMARHMELLPGLRVRISFMDNYNHVKARCKQHIGRMLYNGAFQPDMEDVVAFTKRLYSYVKAGIIDRIETCAEGGLLYKAGPEASDLFAKCYVMQGCLSKEDLRIMGLDVYKAPQTVNEQNRSGCLCLSCKCELLENKHPCGNNCLYCYWQDEMV